MHGHYDIRICNALLVGISMMMSAYFGWSILGGEDGWPFSYGLATIAAIVCYLVSYFAQRASLAWTTRKLGSFVMATAMLAIVIAMNIVADYTTASIFRDQVNVETDNTNLIARNARREVTRIEAAIANLRAETAWRTQFESPETYDALILKQKQIVDRGANVYARTKQCTDTTLPISSQVCQEIARLEADKANAQRRQEILSELKTLGEQLVTAKREAAEQKQVTNPALAQVRSITTWFTLDRQSSDRVDWWGAKAIMLYMTILGTAVITYLGWHIAQLKIQAGVEEQKPRPRQSRWLPAPENHEPIPLKAEDWQPRDPTPGGATVFIKSSSKGVDVDHGALARLMRELEEQYPHLKH